MEEPTSPCLMRHRSSSFGDDETFGQGLPASMSMDEFRRRVRGMLDTYLCSGETDEAVRCFTEFAHETAKFIDEVIVCAVRTALERTEQQREMVSSLLHSLFRQGVLDGPSLVRGFAKLVCTWEDLVLDSGPKAATALVQMLISCIKEGCVQRAFLMKLPEGLLVAVIKDGTGNEAMMELPEVVKQMQEFKQGLEKAKLLKQRTRSGTDDLKARAQGMSKALRKLSMPELHHEFVKRILVASFTWPAAERANCLALLEQLHSDEVLSLDDFQWGAIRLLGQLDDLTLDCPGTSDLAAEHLRSLTAAHLLSTSFLRRCQLLRAGGAAGVAVLEAAQQPAPPESAAAADAAAAALEDDSNGEQDDDEDDDKDQEDVPASVAADADAANTPTTEESSPTPAEEAAPQPRGRLAAGVSLRPGGGGGGSLTGNVSLRPGGGLTGGISLRPGGGGGLTGATSLTGNDNAHRTAATKSQPSQDKKTEKKEKKNNKGGQNEEKSTSWRDDAQTRQDDKQKRKRDKGDRRDNKDGSAAKDDGEEKVKLVASETSWQAQQLKRRQADADAAKSNTADAPSNEEVTRRMKGVLNKLTLEKFDELYDQLVHCGISTENHVRILIVEVFEKATMQHHFIPMYTLLCVNLNEWFTKNVKVGDFKKILLNTCQASFEANLKPPQELAASEEGTESDDLKEQRVKHKMRMLGNIQFVGQLLIKKMVASKVLIAIAEELFSTGTPSALETLANLLKTAGGEYDDPSFKYHKVMGSFFSRLETLAKDKALPPRTRFLLKDVLDLRADGWVDKKLATQKTEGPKKLEDIAGKG